MTRHPSDDQITQWLDTGKPARVARHLEDCEDCMARVEVRSELTDPVIESLESVSAPPTDLPARTTDGVRMRLARADAAGTFVELFALPWQFATVMIEPVEPARPVLPGPMVDRGPETGQDSHDDGERDDG